MAEDYLRRAIAEFVGTFALVVVAAGSVVSGAGLVGGALASGLVIAGMASAVGHVSGAHFNPAVTLGLLVTGRIEVRLAGAYWAAQLAGAVLGGLLLAAAIPNVVTDGVSLGAPLLGGGVGVGPAVVIEAVLTFFLVWVIFATAVDPRGTFRSVAGLPIGAAVAVGILFGGPFTGAAMNPARAFGPQLAGGGFADAWVWWIGPLIGGALAALAYELLYLRPLAPEPVGPPETGIREPRAGDVR